MLHLTPSGLTSILMMVRPGCTPCDGDWMVATITQLNQSTAQGSVHRPLPPARRTDLSDGSDVWLLEVVRSVIDSSARGSIRLADWDRVPHDAEASHLAPLLDVFLRTHEHNAPEAVVCQLRALALRHAAWHRARTAALLEILDEFDRLSIDALALKGAALAWLIYPTPSLRPMADLDVMVPRARAGDAQAALRRLGFGAAAEPGRFRRNAHHLPVAHRLCEALPINVEIHVDALSRDVTASISTSNLTEPPQPFVLNGTRRLTLGHLDMLRHLSHHLLEPTPTGRVRLIGVVDLVAYASTFQNEIDWRRLQADYGLVTNTLACLHHLTALPDTLTRFAPVLANRAPDRVGEVMRPLRSVLMRGLPLHDVLGELFNPPDWWMHAFYNVPLDRSLTPVRVFRHPWQLARWFALRVAGF